MTREEAIKIIRSECYVFNPFNFDSARMINTALDMAIKALEQEPCEDAISRQAAIDALRDAENHAFNAYYKGLKAAHKIIADLPPVTPKGVTVTDFADKCRECEREKVLDKIRAEIEQEQIGYPPSADYYKAIMKCLQIIDKYKAESEVQE